MTLQDNDRQSLIQYRLKQAEETIQDVIKKIDANFGKIVNKAFNRRTKSDYDSFVEIEKEIVNEMFDEMKEFISEIKRITLLN